MMFSWLVILTKCLFIFQNFLCSVCGLFFKSLQHENRHKKIGPYQCEECDMVFYSKVNYQRHNLRHSDKKKLFKCDTCGKTFKMKIDLKRHQKREKKDLKFKCSLCDKQYESVGALQDHEGSHHGGSKGGGHRCDVCNKVFKHKPNLYRHKKIHSGEKFTCVVCSAEFPTRRYLFDHLKSHDPSDQKKCMRCFKLFKNRKCLLQHIKNVH